MDATEWRTADDLRSMLQVVCTQSADPRKMRLLAAAFSRHGGAFPHDKEWQRLLVCVERMADGGQIDPGLPKYNTFFHHSGITWLSKALQTQTAYGAPFGVGINGSVGDRKHATLFREIVRDVFDNPFDPPTLAQTPNDELRLLAAGIYESFAFERMGELGKKLREAGIQDSRLLAHCDGRSIHVRGCWVLDLVMGTRART